jgi:glycopeptide antibiotics resistance protein
MFWSPVMSRPLLSLKAGAIIFTVLWTAWMMWWSGSCDRVNLVILTMCGAVVGYVWYRAMRWQFERMGMLPRSDDVSAKQAQ